MVKLTKKKLRQLERKDERRKDREWVEAVRKKWDYKCAYCGCKEKPNAHHIIPRENRNFRWDVMNGILLCSKHHRFSRQFSAHQNPLIFTFWLINHFPNIVMYLENKWRENENSRTSL